MAEKTTVSGFNFNCSYGGKMSRYDFLKFDVIPPKEDGFGGQPPTATKVTYDGKPASEGARACFLVLRELIQGLTHDKGYH